MFTLKAAVRTVLAAAMVTPAAAAGAVETDMSKGGVTFRSGDYSLHIGARAQVRWTGTDAEDLDKDVIGGGLGEEDGFSQEFEAKRMRLKLDGTVYRPWLGYTFQFEFADTSGEDDNKVKDAIIEVNRHRLAGVRVGQFKVPFSLQQLTSSGSQEFVDRAITDPKFAPGRDQGIVLHGRTTSRAFGYEVGAFNGSAESRAQDDQGLMYVGRVVWDPLGEYKLSESANDHPDKHVLHFGLSARTGEATRGLIDPGVFEDPPDETAMGLEAAWRRRRLFAMGEYFMMTNETLDASAVDPNDPNTFSLVTEGPDVDSKGFNAQFGVMVVPKEVEVGVRYAQVDPDDDTDDDEVTEARIVFGYYFDRHSLKVQADAGTITWGENFGDQLAVVRRNLPSLGGRLVSGEELTDAVYRVQMQVSF
jgi:phosphate-selective porin OprO/OprP